MQPLHHYKQILIHTFCSVGESSYVDWPSDTLAPILKVVSVQVQNEPLLKRLRRL